MLSPYIVSGYTGACIGYIYGHIQSKYTDCACCYNLHYSKKNKIIILYSIVGFISGGFIGKMFS